MLFISARSDESEQIRGLKNGVNDYITKQCLISILLAKIAVHINQRSNKDVDMISYKGLTVSSKSFKLTDKATNCELIDNELIIINCLIADNGQDISRNTLLEPLWDDTNFIDDNRLTLNIARVRRN